MSKAGARNGAVIGIVVLIGLGFSYLEERPKYAFEAMVADQLKNAPWVRAVGSMSTADLTSPVSWIWPAKTTWRIAQPALGDGTQTLRFQASTITFPDDASVYLLDVDCRARSIHAADVNQPATAEPMFNVLGEPIHDGHGRAYRYIASSQPWPTDDLAEYCNTDWSIERQALPTSPIN